MVILGWSTLIFPLIISVLISVVYFSCKDCELFGPNSPSGIYHVLVEVSDRGFGPGADFYTDVIILDENGRELLRWADPDGQQSEKDSLAVVKSILWVDEQNLELTTYMRGTVNLTVVNSNSGRKIQLE